MQWYQRLERLHTVRDRFAAANYYDRAYKTCLTIQHVYDRWADELLRQQAQGR